MGYLIKDNKPVIIDGAVVEAEIAKSQQKVVDLSMSTGNQFVIPNNGYLLSRVVINKPSTLIPANIKLGVSIGGVTGIYTADYEEFGDCVFNITIDDIEPYDDVNAEEILKSVIVGYTMTPNAPQTCSLFTLYNANDSSCEISSLFYPNFTLFSSKYDIELNENDFDKTQYFYLSEMEDSSFKAITFSPYFDNTEPFTVNIKTVS